MCGTPTLAVAPGQHEVIVRMGGVSISRKPVGPRSDGTTVARRSTDGYGTSGWQTLTFLPTSEYIPKGVVNRLIEDVERAQRWPCGVPRLQWIPNPGQIATP